MEEGDVGPSHVECKRHKSGRVLTRSIPGRLVEHVLRESHPLHYLSEVRSMEADSDLSSTWVRRILRSNRWLRVSDHARMRRMANERVRPLLRRFFRRILCFKKRLVVSYYWDNSPRGKRCRVIQSRAHAVDEWGSFHACSLILPSSHQHTPLFGSMQDRRSLAFGLRAGGSTAASVSYCVRSHNVLGQTSLVAQLHREVASVIHCLVSPLLRGKST